MNKKVKQNRDGSITVTMNGKDNAEFWAEVERESAEWQSNGYTLMNATQGGNTFQDSALTSLLNIFRTLFGRPEKHDPVVKMIFMK